VRRESRQNPRFSLLWVRFIIFFALWSRAWASAENVLANPEAGSQEPTQEGQPSLERLARLVEEQGKLIEQQAKEIEELRQSLEDTKNLALSANNRLNELQQKPPEPTVPAALEQRLAALEQTAQKVPEMPAAEVKPADFPGSFPIPGTDAAIKFGGQVRTTLVHSADALGTDDRFVTSSIPAEGTQEAGKGARFSYSARPSRANIDFRSPTAVGPMRAFIEADFAGSSNAFRLRHAYGQWKKLIIGQTWSTFSDPEAEPDGIDFEGLNAISLFRQVQIRWTQPLRERLAFSLAIEDPAPSVTGANGVSLTPDLIARLRWEPEKKGLLERLGHVQTAVLVRTIRAEPFDQPNQTLTTGGIGGNVSGVLTPRWDGDDQFKFAAYAGTGIGRYITDLGTLGGQDAYYDSATNTLKALPVFAAYYGYERLWKPRFRSTFTYGIVQVDNLDIQPDDSLRRTQRVSANILWSPVRRIDVVLELLAGRRVNKDGRLGTAKQVQAGWTFRF